ncbi:hypothetical protein FCOIX_10933 [Fusarium coicis]|nr:hypothetical protein FCOIX_10933 [Fusarium coicis]
MTSTVPVRQLIGQWPQPPPDFSTYPTPCGIANLPQGLWLQISSEDSYKRFCKDILEGKIEDTVLASLVIRRLQEQLRAPRSPEDDSRARTEGAAEQRDGGDR